MFLSEEQKCRLKEFLQKIDFLQGMPEYEILQLIDSLERKSYQKGQTIVFQGEISLRLYLIFEGKVAVLAKQGKEKKKIAELGPGEYFGEISLLEPTTAGATIRAEEPCELYALSREDFMSVAGKIPGSLEAIRSKIAARKESLAKSKETEVE